MIQRPYLLIVKRFEKAHEVVKLRTWKEVTDYMAMEGNKGTSAVAYNLVSEVETHFDEEGEVTLTK